MGFKWGQELLKAKQIIKEQDECCGILNKINDDLKEENKALKQEIEELRKDYLEMHSEYKDYYYMNQQLIKEQKNKSKIKRWTCNYHHIYSELQKVINVNKKILEGHNDKEIIVSTLTEILDEWVKKVKNQVESESQEEEDDN
jgi:hypothetical protein